MKKVGILGCGTMGSGIGQVCAQSEMEVVMWDINDELATTSNIEGSLQRQVDRDRMEQSDMDAVMGRISATSDMEELKDCDIVIEAIIENMEIKRDTFKKLDEICDEKTILATNTSSLSITDIANATEREDKVVGMHFFNPVPVMKLVEVIKGIHTSEETRKEVFELSEKLGKTPVDVEEAPGFVVNRILVPMVNEAIGIFAEGIASAEHIDQAMKLGANHPMGPLALGDLIGLDVVLAIMDVLYDEFGDSKYRAHPLLRKMVRGNILGRKTKKGFFEY